MRCSDYATWWLKPARGADWREYAHGVPGGCMPGTLVAQLDGVDTREAALALKGSEIGVPRAALPAAPETRSTGPT